MQEPIKLTEEQIRDIRLSREQIAAGQFTVVNSVEELEKLVRPSTKPSDSE